MSSPLGLLEKERTWNDHSSPKIKVEPKLKIGVKKHLMQLDCSWNALNATLRGAVDCGSPLMISEASFATPNCPV